MATPNRLTGSRVSFRNGGHRPRVRSVGGPRRRRSWPLAVSRRRGVGVRLGTRQATARQPAGRSDARGDATSQLVELRREYFVPNTYEDWSAYMTVEAAQRVVAFYIMLGVAVVPMTIISLLVFGLLLDLVSGGFVTSASISGSAGIDLSVLAPVVIFSTGKAVVDWSRRTVGIRTDTDGLVGWFTPENLHLREWEQERR